MLQSVLIAKPTHVTAKVGDHCLYLAWIGLYQPFQLSFPQFCGLLSSYNLCILQLKIVPSGISEDTEPFGEPGETAQEWARRKALAVAERIGVAEDHWYLGVDTIVVIGGEILGKPCSGEEACSFLRRLSGNWHEVISAYCLRHPCSGRAKENLVSSRVKIAELGAEEIETYVATGEPLDKAGAYAVQGIGAFMVEEIQGSYTNVVGLPLTELIRDLERLEIIEVRGEK